MTTTRPRKSKIRKTTTARSGTPRKPSKPSAGSAAKRSTAKRSTGKRSTAKRETPKRSRAKRPTTKRSTARRSTASRSTTTHSTPKRSAHAKTKRTTASHSTGAANRTQPKRSGIKRSTGRVTKSGLIHHRRRGRRRDAPVTDAGERNAAFLTATVLGLTLFGLVMVLSASSVSSLYQYADSPFFQFKRQVMWAGIGALAFLAASRLDYRRLQPAAKPLLIVTIVLLVALFVPGIGISRNYSTRWLGVGPLVIQPSELAKLVLIVFMADLLARRERRMDRPELTVRPAMLVLGLLSVLIVAQPKLGTPIIMAGVTMLLLFVAGAQMKSLLAWLSLAVVGASLLAYLAPYRRRRLFSFLNPWEDPLGDGLQAIQSQVGIASGGLFGVGLGASRAKWGFLPFAHTDFIFAIVAEEVGLIGASALIGGFLLIGWFGFKTAMAAPDRFGMLLAAGITSWLLIQAFLNIGMVLGVLPITGEPLPFVSAGGSSLVTTLAAAGLLTSVSRRARA